MLAVCGVSEVLGGIMTTEMENITSQAIEWHIRLYHGDDALWEAFTVWLAEDDRHVAAYEAVENADHEIDPLLPDVVFREAANDSGEQEPSIRGSKRRWVLAGGALAASAALALLLIPRFAPDRYEIATRAGETRIVTLDAGTRIILNGATRMTFDRKDARFAALAGGEALFHVRHDAANPFRLDVGDTSIEDAGTIFNVVRDAGKVRVAVAEGKVVYNPGKDGIPLDAGQGLEDAGDGEPVRVAPTPVEAVGSWQNRQLIYRGEALSQVAQDLSRALDVRITVSPVIAARPFHGTIAIDGSGAGQLDRLKRALGVELEAVSGNWNMKPVDSGDQ